METQVWLNWPLSHDKSFIWGAERGMCTKIEEWKNKQIRWMFFKWPDKFVSTKEWFKRTQPQLNCNMLYCGNMFRAK